MEDATKISIDEINSELQRILNFSLFKNSPTLSRFLEYIVLETAGGKERNIKEYSIAVDVLNRPPNFNSHDDAVVRIHAGRLRRTLNEYYLTEGTDNPIVIFIPKGCYIPEFKLMEQARLNGSVTHTISTKRTNPIVAIFPFRCISYGEETGELSVILEEGISAELSRIPNISVIGYYSREMLAKINQNTLEAGRLIGADYIITGTLQCTGQRIRLRAMLLSSATGEVIIAKSEDKDAIFDLFEVQDEIIHSVAAAMSGYYGFILQKTGIEIQ